MMAIMREMVHALKSSPNHPHTSNEGYEILKQQWMPLLIAHDLISCAVVVTKICEFVLTYVTLNSSG